jgi:23S rRNA (adenine2503-C2)-methyltransferase
MMQGAVTTNLLGMDRTSLQNFFISRGEQPYRAVQLLKWIHNRGIADFDLMTDMSKSLRANLQTNCVIQPPEVQSEHVASDGTRKWLIAVPGGSSIETVFIPEKKRGTLCISSQVGCALNCTFCSTGRQGFQRNLSAAEIIGQLWVARDRLRAVTDSELCTEITNVVMMGMGEPLLNFEAVACALSIMRDEHGYELPRRRVTVSTSGLVPAMDRLAAECDVSLALSLHAPTDELRDVLVPINKKYQLAEVLDACKRYVSKNKRYFITMEYVMLKGINDSVAHAKKVAALLRNVPCKINLIPFNPFPNSGYECSDEDSILDFANILSDSDYVCTTRKTRGQDIDAACGQLAGMVLDRTKRSQRFKEQQE